MSHPLIYVFGDTEQQDFPLILTIGREPNYDDVLNDEIGIINIDEFMSSSSGVWVTAYTQISKQIFGKTGTSGQLKKKCFQRNSSPIAFTNAFPRGIANDVKNKSAMRQELLELIPNHINNIFSKTIIKRVKLVIQHGTDKSPSSILASQLIEKKCSNLGIQYCTTPFFTNINSKKIQSSLSDAQPEIRNIFEQF